MERDRFVDFVRVASVVIVVAGHWLVLVPYVDQGLAGGRPLYAVDSRFWPLTWVFNVLPLFFFAGGFANFASFNRRSEGGGFQSRRLRRLLLPTLAFLGAWTLAEAVLQALNAGAPGLLRGFRLGQTTPFETLWFLALYLAIVLLTPFTIRLHRRFGWMVPASLLALTCVTDLVAWRTGIASLLLLNLAFVWLLPHQLGHLYADGRLDRLPPRALLAISGAGLVVTLVLTSLPFYGRNLLDGQVAVLGVAGPTVPVALLSVSMVSAALAARRPLEAWLAQKRPWRVVRRLNSIVMTLFLWHMTAYFATLAVVAGWGLPLPQQPNAVWWAERPLFLTLPLLVLVPLVWLFAPFERAGRSRSNPEVLLPVA